MENLNIITPSEFLKQCCLHGGFYENKKIIVKVGEFISKKKGKSNE